MRSGRRAPRKGRAGFTLVELMAVITLVAVLALLAIPAMSRAQDDRRAYDDAGAIMQLVRAARARAVARGAAVMVAMTAGPSDRGTFQVWEAVKANPPNAGGGAAAPPLTPVGTCLLPTVWPPNANATAQWVDGVNMNGAREAQADVRARIRSVDGAEVPALYVCFTPLGHAYLSTSSPPVFGPGQPFNGAFQIVVTREGTTGIERRVVVPPSGAARLVSL